MHKPFAIATHLRVNMRVNNCLSQPCLNFLFECVTLFVPEVINPFLPESVTLDASTRKLYGMLTCFITLSMINEILHTAYVTSVQALNSAYN